MCGVCVCVCVVVSSLWSWHVYSATSVLYLIYSYIITFVTFNCNRWPSSLELIFVCLSKNFFFIYKMDWSMAVKIIYGPFIARVNKVNMLFFIRQSNSNTNFLKKISIYLDPHYSKLLGQKDTHKSSMASYEETSKSGLFFPEDGIN